MKIFDALKFTERPVRLGTCSQSKSPSITSMPSRDMSPVMPVARASEPDNVGHWEANAVASSCELIVAVGDAQAGSLPDAMKIMSVS